MSNRVSAVATAMAIMLLALVSANAANAARGSGGDNTSRSCLSGAAQSLLSQIEGRFGSVRLVSTCRPGATIAGTGRVSRHASGNAFDFEAGGRKGEIIRWLVANHRSGGTMTYSGMSHIHADIGPHFVSLSGGERYASNSGRSERSRGEARSTRSSGDRTASTTSSRSQRSSKYQEVSSFMGATASVRAGGS
jgi:hypothetical protein